MIHSARVVEMSHSIPLTYYDTLSDKISTDKIFVEQNFSLDKTVEILMSRNRGIRNFFESSSSQICISQEL